MPKSSDDEAPSISISDFARQLLTSAIGLGCLTLLLYIMFRPEDLAPPTPEPSLNQEIRYTPEPRGSDVCGSITSTASPILLHMVTSKDAYPWLDLAANEFVFQCPQIKIKLSALDDLQAVEEIASGKQRPTIFAPTDELSLRLLEHQRQPTVRPINLEAKVELLESPLVLLMWEDRLRILSTLLREQKSEDGQWVRGLCALIPHDPELKGLTAEAMTPGKWADWYGLLRPERLGRRTSKVRPKGAETPIDPQVLESWGSVKIRHTRPTRAVAGVATLYLMAYEYLLPPGEAALSTGTGELTKALPEPSEEAPAASPAKPPDVAFAAGKPSLLKWLRRCESGIEAPPSSEPALADAFFEEGPSVRDGIITYESVALPILRKIDGKAEHLNKMVLVYPRPNLVSRHPAVILSEDIAQKAAAQSWLKFLRRYDIQEKAIDFGLRPANKEVRLQDHHSEKNGFLGLRRYGVIPNLHLTEAPLPSGRTIAELIKLWSDATGRD